MALPQARLTHTRAQPIAFAALPPPATSSGAPPLLHPYPATMLSSSPRTPPAVTTQPARFTHTGRPIRPAPAGLADSPGQRRAAPPGHRERRIGQIRAGQAFEEAEAQERAQHGDEVEYCAELADTASASASTALVTCPAVRPASPPPFSPARNRRARAT